MIISCFIYIVSIITDVILSITLKNFIPLFSLSALIISIYLLKDNKNSYILIFIFGIIYDLVNTDFIFLHAFIFISLNYIVRIFLNKNNNFIKALIIYVLSCFIYSLVIILFTFLYNNYNYSMILYKLKNSIILNVIYFTVLYISFIGINNIHCNTIKKTSYF